MLVVDGFSTIVWYSFFFCACQWAPPSQHPPSLIVGRLFWQYPLNLQDRKDQGGVKFEINAMVSEQRTPIHENASQRDAFFMYWGSRPKLSSALNPKKKWSKQESLWVRVVIINSFGRPKIQTLWQRSRHFTEQLILRQILYWAMFSSRHFLVLRNQY